MFRATFLKSGVCKGSSTEPLTRSGTRSRASRSPPAYPRFEIARMMGTSIEQIEKTYGHLLPDALDRGRAALDAFDSSRAESFGH